MNSKRVYRRNGWETVLLGGSSDENLDFLNTPSNGREKSRMLTPVRIQFSILSSTNILPNEKDVNPVTPKVHPTKLHLSNRSVLLAPPDREPRKY